MLLMLCGIFFNLFFNFVFLFISNSNWQVAPKRKTADGKVAKGANLWLDIRSVQQSVANSTVLTLARRSLSGAFPHHCVVLLRSRAL